jgi:hypothetical protein
MGTAPEVRSTRRAPAVSEYAIPRIARTAQTATLMRTGVQVEIVELAESVEDARPPVPEYGIARTINPTMAPIPTQTTKNAATTMALRRLLLAISLYTFSPTSRTVGSAVSNSAGRPQELQIPPD